MPLAAAEPGSLARKRGAHDAELMANMLGVHRRRDGGYAQLQKDGLIPTAAAASRCWIARNWNTGHASATL